MLDAFLQYLAVMLGPDPDPLNDWLTHLPDAVQPAVLLLGKLIAYVIGA